jgi:hypothetical protein
MMNIPCPEGQDVPMAYRHGHRDARHSAAEIANEVDARLAGAERLLRRALNQSARVHGDFAGDIQAWLADSASPVTCGRCGQPSASHPTPTCWGLQAPETVNASRSDTGDVHGT